IVATEDIEAIRQRAATLIIAKDLLALGGREGVPPDAGARHDLAPAGAACLCLSHRSLSLLVAPPSAGGRLRSQSPPSAPHAPARRTRARPRRSGAYARTARPRRRLP